MKSLLDLLQSEPFLSGEQLSSWNLLAPLYRAGTPLTFESTKQENKQRHIVLYLTPSLFQAWFQGTDPTKKPRSHPHPGSQWNTILGREFLAVSYLEHIGSMGRWCVFQIQYFRTLLKSTFNCVRCPRVRDLFFLLQFSSGMREDQSPISQSERGDLRFCFLNTYLFSTILDLS